jgi:hypothetical protein
VTLRHYFVEGLNAKEISLKLNISWGDVRDKLREVGIVLADGTNDDPVNSAIREHGYTSFDAFVRVNGLEDMTTQARILGVSRSALTRSYDAYGKFIASESSSGDDTGPASAADDSASSGDAAGE